MLSQYEIIKKPLISEKNAALGELLNVYAFEVHKAASKPEIKTAVEKLFSVKVKAVRTSIVHGEIKRFGKGVKKRPNWKKALITLEKGQKIELFQGV